MKSSVNTENYLCRCQGKLSGNPDDLYNETFPLIIASIYRHRIVIDVTTRGGTQLFRAKNDSPRRRALSFHSPAFVNQWISKDLSCDEAVISLVSSCSFLGSCRNSWYTCLNNPIHLPPNSTYGIYIKPLQRCWFRWSPPGVEICSSLGSCKTWWYTRTTQYIYLLILPTIYIQSPYRSVDFVGFLLMPRYVAL